MTTFEKLLAKYKNRGIEFKEYDKLSPLSNSKNP